MSRHIRFAEGFRNPENPWPVRLACLFALVWVLLPFNEIPIIGWIDDLLVVVPVIMFVINRRREASSIRAQRAELRAQNPAQF